ncbi:MAG: hypothetical protein ABJF10_20195, partial [Chthoniobacter sp.]|uniref:hypothetical protein n=1 Tax=Chthoniobacter sp. TaxID=2510640 RepID=UPI0032AC89ED
MAESSAEEQWEIPDFLNMGCPVFVRSVHRTRWEQAMDAVAIEDWEDAVGILDTSDGELSVWNVESNLDLRRVCFAINESRGSSLTQAIQALRILPSDFDSAKIERIAKYADETKCPAAARLHWDAQLRDCYALLTGTRRRSELE